MARKPSITRRGSPHAGYEVRERILAYYGLTHEELAKAIGVSRRTISLLVNGHRGVSPEMSLRLSKLSGTTPEHWLGIQQIVDLERARRTGKAAVARIKTLKTPRGARK
ncbi:MAG: HigA family addiction module antidote protein [Alphaproteobacteria bacterium]|nr:HigA family addiction module antidote protein [Alphaproteobacteria bacterium]